MAEPVLTEETPAERSDNDRPLRPSFVRSVLQALDTRNAARLRELVGTLHSADMADLFELVRPDERRALIELLGDSFDVHVLHELEEGVRDEVMRNLEPDVLAAALQELDTDDAVYLLEDMEEKDKEKILDLMPALDRQVLERGLEYTEDSAGRIMQRELVVVPPFWTVGQVIDYMRDTDDLAEDFFEIFVVDPAFRPLGTVPLNRILRTKRPVTVEEIMETEPTLIPVDMDQEDVAYQFEQYDLVSAAVIDENGRLVGVITVDDILDVIQEEAEEDILRLAGVGDDEITDTVFETTRRRFTWLLVNLGTAVLASVVIGLFDATIEQMVALAILMPIVASMGGNAGTQTMTVAVRRLSTKDILPINVGRVVARELMVGVLNGLLFAVIIGAVAYLWFGNLYLGFVIGAAMIVNMFVAGLSGILIPLILDRLNIDPAVASTVFVTTVTDVIGFFAFLGLAALLLL